MKKGKVRTFRSRLREDLKDPEFRAHYQEERQALNLAMKIAKKNNLPFVYHWLDVLHWLIPFKPFQAVGKIVESRVLKQNDMVVTVSDKLREFVIKLGAPPERTQIVKPGISLSKFDPTISGAAKFYWLTTICKQSPIRFLIIPPY